MTKWQLHTIGDLVREKIIAEPMDGNHGEMHPKGNDFKKIGIPFIMASDIKNSLIDFGRCKYISKYQADELRKGFSQAGDVLLSHKATIGETAIVPKLDFPYLMLTPQVTYYRVLDSNKLNNKFLKYYFDSPLFQKILKLRAGAGSTRAYLGIIAQKDLPISIPDIRIQKQIVDVLSVIDEKIEINNQINSELEAMVKLIYDYWFVQFDFPDENGKPYKSSGGKMIYNKDLKRKIPMGWGSGKLGDFEQKIITGKTPSTDDENNFDGDIPFICIGDVRGNMYITKTEITLSKVGAASQANKFIPKDSICVTCIASPGLVGFATSESQTNQQLNTIVCSKKENRYFLYFYLKEYFNYSKAKMGNTFANMNKDDFSSILLPYPKDEIVDSFSKKVKSIFDLVLQNSKENDLLTKKRDWLLPMLMNGQIKISEAG